MHSGLLVRHWRRQHLFASSFPPWYDCWISEQNASTRKKPIPFDSSRHQNLTFKDDVLNIKLHCSCTGTISTQYKTHSSVNPSSNSNKIDTPCTCSFFCFITMHSGLPWVWRAHRIKCDLTNVRNTYAKHPVQMQHLLQIHQTPHPHLQPPASDCLVLVKPLLQATKCSLVWVSNLPRP